MPETARAKPSWRWLVLLTVIVGTFLGRLDQTIVNLALPKIIGDFNITVSAAGWIATAYILANAVFVPVWGKLGDTIGRKKVYLIGFGIFIAGSVLAGLSWDLGSMIVFRVIQAIASSADYPTAMAILAVTFPTDRERTQALGIWSSAFAASSVLGPLIGGPLIDSFGWRSVFLVNLPVGIIGVLMAVAFVEESVSVEGRGERSFDWWGAITLGISLSAFVLVLDRGFDWGWFSWGSVVCYLITAVFGMVFWYIERTHREPIVDFKFFKNGIFTNTLVNNVIIFMAMIGSIFLIPIFAQTFLGYDATAAGYLFIPMAAALMVGAPLGGALAGKVAPRYVIAGSTLIAAGSIYSLSFLDPRSSAMDIMVPLAIMAFGLGFGMPQRTSLITATVPQEEVGVASSVLALARNIAGALGIAVFNTILSNTVEWNVLSLARGSALYVKSPAALREMTGLITLKAQVNAYGTVFFIASLVLVVGAVTAFWIRAGKETGAGAHAPVLVE